MTHVATGAVRPEDTLNRALELAKQDRLAEAEQMICAGLASFPKHKRLLRQLALLAEKMGNMELALQRWADLREKAPNATAGYIGALRTLSRFKHLELAPPLIEDALRRFPDDIDIVVWAAELADTAKKVDEADVHWRHAMALCPDRPEYALSAAMCLIGHQVGRVKRMRELFRRLQAIHEKFPDFVPAYTAHVGAFRETQELEEADRYSAAWCSRYPDDVKLALARVGVLEELKRFAEAAKLLGALRQRVEPTGELEAAYIRALSSAGKFDEAESVWQDAAKRFPKNRKVLCEFAHVATRRGEWALALERLLDVQKALPQDSYVTRQIQQVRLLMAEPPADSESAVNTLAGRFESLGGSSGGCEFGLIQRRLGSDTVGLLRWTRIDPPQLIEALNCDFEGVGAEENTVLSPRRVALDQEEWSTTDKRFFMETHTFVRVIDAPEDKMFAQTCRRLRFLRGKMLQDLQEANKIFVYKAYHRLEDAEILPMHAALARYGNNALLCVMRAGKGEKRGTVREIAPGVYVGYVGHFMKDDTGNPGYDIDGWRMALEGCELLWHKHGSVAAADQAA